MRKKSDYTAFVEKFKPKLTTDDCFTPPDIYEVVKAWTLREYGIGANTRILRPFNPEGDYQAEDYSGDCVVIDNPPFSILAQIVDYYLERGIRFLLFAPHLTLFTYGNREGLTCVVCGVGITYENGAVVKTSYLTNLSPEIGIRVAGDLHQTISEVDRTQTKGKTQARYTYPNEVLTVSDFNRISKAGDNFSITRDSLHFVRSLEEQHNQKKAIYGAGYLISERVARDIITRDITARDVIARDVVARKIERDKRNNLGRLVWELSPRERAIIQGLT